MKYNQALVIATEWMRKLQPFCDRIAIAGSIRREKPEVKDIELVCIPKIIETPTLFGATVGRHPEFVSALSPNDEFMIEKGDPREGKYFKLWLIGPSISIDIFTTVAENWGHILAIRTGSADYSHHVLANGWVRAGYHSEHGHLMLGEKRVIIREEDQLFNIIGVPYTEPKNRVWP